MITDTGLAHLENLFNLRSLAVRGTEITDAGLAHLAGLENLEELDLGINRLTDAGLVHLKGLKSLRKLRLSATNITDAGLVQLEAMKSLESLVINSTMVTEAGVDAPPPRPARAGDRVQTRPGIPADLGLSRGPGGHARGCRRVNGRWRRGAGPGWTRGEVLLPSAPPAPDRPGKLPAGPISEIRFEGNATIPAEKIKTKLLSKAGRPFNLRRIDADVKNLMRTNWFSQVEAYHDEQPPSGHYILIFVVREMPVLKVELRGRSDPLEDIEDNTGLKKGNRADPMSATHNAVRSITGCTRRRATTWPRWN